jgi:hypothetical protein
VLHGRRRRRWAERRGFWRGEFSRGGGAVAGGEAEWSGVKWRAGRVRFLQYWAKLPISGPRLTF